MRAALRHRVAIAWLIALALLAAQAFGVAHRVRHAPGLGAAKAAFAGHAPTTDDCRLYDQHGHGPGLVAALPVWTPPPLHAAAPALPAPAWASAGTPSHRARDPPRNG